MPIKNQPGGSPLANILGRLSKGASYSLAALPLGPYGMAAAGFAGAMQNPNNPTGAGRTMDVAALGGGLYSAGAGKVPTQDPALAAQAGQDALVPGKLGLEGNLANANIMQSQGVIPPTLAEWLEKLRANGITAPK